MQLILSLGRHFTLFPLRVGVEGLAEDGYDCDWNPPFPFNKRMWAGAKMSFQRVYLLGKLSGY